MRERETDELKENGFTKDYFPSMGLILMKRTSGLPRNKRENPQRDPMGYKPKITLIVFFFTSCLISSR